jgi:hypothetical protein
VTPADNLPRRGVYDSRFVLYRATPTLTDEQVKSLDALWLDLFQQDGVVLNVNGQIVHPRGTHHGEPVVPLERGVLRAGANRIVVLYENKGWGNFGRAPLEAVAGLRAGLLTSAKMMGMPVQEWRCKLIERDRDDANSLTGVDVADADWPHFTLDEAMAQRLATPIQPGSETEQDQAARILFGQRRVAVFRSSFDITEADLRAGRSRLTFDRIDDTGRVFVNGQQVGQSKSWDKPATFDLAKTLKPGRNVVAVIVDNSGGGEGGVVRPVHLECEKLEGVDLHWQLATDIQIPGAGWQTIELDTQKKIDRKGSGTSTIPQAKADALLTWYRMEFELPAPAKNTWIPWCAVLDASGNGFVAVNGHDLGRYWEIGPQREFYMPECWLKFGPGEKNLLTIQLRSTERDAQLRAAEITPCPNQAEYRTR